VQGAANELTLQVIVMEVASNPESLEHSEARCPWFVRAGGKTRS